MIPSSVLSEITGVRCTVLGDRDGALLEATEASAAAETVSAVSAVLGRELGRMADLLGLGAATAVTIKNGRSAWVIAYGPDLAMAVEADPTRPLTNLEARLREIDWSALASSNRTPAGPEEADDDQPTSDVPTLRPIAAPAPPSKTPAETPLHPVKHLHPPAKPRRSGQSAEAVPAPAALTSSANAADIGADRKALRRALVKGQLSRAESIAARLRSLPPVGPDPCGSGESALALPPLMEGIASALSGNGQGALKSFEALAEMAHTGASLRWVCQVWSARAAAATPEGLAAASVHGESALRLSLNLDVEARAVSTLLLADLAFHQGELERALELVRNARHLLSRIRDDHDLAASWLLEARILAASGNESESVPAARRAQQHRPSWAPPATFLAKCALHAGQIEQAEQVLAPMASRKPVDSEIERSRRLLEQVRAGVVPAQVVYDFLRLLDLPQRADHDAQLQAMADSYPQVDHFRDALGWRLLRTGDYGRAATLFEQLGAKSDLAEDLRASVLLALGCLAAVGSRHAAPGAKLRAAVEAAPAHLQSEVPPSPPVPAAASHPVEFEMLDAMSGVTETFKPDEPRTSPRVAHGGPVFAGSLRVFCLPDLLEFLRSGQRTGTLVCSSGAGIAAIHLRLGKITAAATPSTRALSSYLLARRVIDAEQLQRAVRIQESSEPRRLIGGILINEGLATPAQVRDALREQIHDAVAQVLTWTDGQFAFDPEVAVAPSPSEVELELDPQGVLLDIFRLIDETAKASS